MATLRDIKRRIRAVSNTRQITKAMKMVSAAKLRKSQARMSEMRPYAEKMAAVLKSLASGADSSLHPLLASRPRKTVEVIILTSDRGLCGAFNTNIMKAAVKLTSGLQSEGLQVNVSVIGKKAADYFKRRDLATHKVWVGISGRIAYANAQEIAKDVMENFVSEDIDEVVLIYNEFRSVLVQQVSVVKILPLAAIEVGDTTEALSVSADVDFLYEPQKGEIFNTLLPKNVEIQIYRALLESQASEEAARMTAMGNATKNANEMIDKLTLQYNKARQATITRELMDIVGGVEALKA